MQKVYFVHRMEIEAPSFFFFFVLTFLVDRRKMKGEKEKRRIGLSSSFRSAICHRGGEKREVEEKEKENN